MANEQSKTGTQAESGANGASTGNGTQEQSGGMAGFNASQLPDGRASFTVPASLGQALEPKRLLWYGGLAALGVVGVLEWPVLAVVGAATYVTERFARDDAQQPGQR